MINASNLKTSEFSERIENVCRLWGGGGGKKVSKIDTKQISESHFTYQLLTLLQ